MSNNQPITYKITRTENLTLQEVLDEIKAGGSFVIYSYCFSLIAVTVYRPSAAVFIRSNEDPQKIGNKYSLLSIIFGWWGIPWGPIRTIQAITNNRKGGIDFTKEILSALTEKSLEQGEVELKQAYMLFYPPDIYHSKEIVKAISPILENDSNVKEVYVGVFINTAEYEDPYYVLGINCADLVDFNAISQKCNAELLKVFQKETQFKFFRFSEDIKLAEAITEQGVHIYPFFAE